MDETMAIARLPRLEIEIRHRRLPEEQAEQLAISLRVTPSFAAFAQFLERRPPWPWAAPWPWLAPQPWLWFGQMVQASWQPWLAASSALLGSASPPPPARRPPVAPSLALTQAADLGVHRSAKPRSTSDTRHAGG